MFNLERLATWFLIFITYSFLGWAMEVFLSILQRKKLINRGFLIGPVCPIYGVGALAVSFVLSPDYSPLAIFCVSLVGSAIIEYVSSFIMEQLFRVRWWDYSEKVFNLNGRICLEAAFGFGVIGILIIKFATPFLLGVFQSLPTIVLYCLAGAAFLGFAFDIALSLWLIIGVRVTVGTVQRDATDEISERVREILMDKGKLNRRLVGAFPNQSPSKKKPRQKSTRKSSAKAKSSQASPEAMSPKTATKSDKSA